MKIGYLMQAGAPDMQMQPRSGPAAHVWHVCRELQALGHEVSLLTFAGNRMLRSDDLVNFQPVQVRMDRGALRLFERGTRRVQSTLHLPYLHFFDSMRFASACWQELGSCDLLYERMGWMGCGGAIAARRSGQPLVLEVNGDHLAEYEMLGVAPQGVQRKASVRFMRWATAQAAWVVATGEGWRRRFLQRWPVDPARVSVVENGSEVVQLLTRASLANFQDSLAPAGQPVRLVYVGAFEPWHGILVLIQALAKVVGRNCAVHLDLIGDGSARPEIERLIAENRLAPYVTLHGFLRIEQAAPILGRGEIGLSPYCGRVEYSGLKLLDYKAAGLATIASGEGGEPAVLRHGETGWIVPPCDVEQLAEAISTLYADAPLRRQIGQAARIEAEAEHSWRHTAVQLQAIFAKVAR
ncbi:MAG: glycosyltransferase family 4 protein [Caldilineaceae bacterium]